MHPRFAVRAHHREHALDTERLDPPQQLGEHDLPDEPRGAREQHHGRRFAHPFPPARRLSGSTVRFSARRSSSAAGENTRGRNGCRSLPTPW
jgi:hypothetical protein